MKKVIALLMALLLLVPGVAFAEETAEDAWMNILLLGGDARSKEEYGRTDMMMILSINKVERTAKMSSIMRDTWVENMGLGYTQKINAANVYGGPDLAVASVEKCFGVDISGYIMVNMYDIVAIIDMLGGVTVDVSESERNNLNSYVGEYLRKFGDYDGQTVLEATGVQHLNGLLAMSYTRDRYSDSDYGRVMRQQEVLIGMAKSAQDANVTDLLALSVDVASRVTTNMAMTDLIDIAMVCLDVKLDEVGQNRLPVDGTFTAGMYKGNWCIRPNYEKNQRLLREFIYGK